MEREFAVNSALKDEVLKRLSHNYKRYTVGVAVSAIFLTAVLAALIVIWVIQRDSAWDEKVFSTIEVLIIPIIVIGIAMAIALSGGRGAWMLRRDEKIVIRNGRMVYSFTDLNASGPIEIVGTTEFALTLSDIHQAQYNPKWHRMDLVADYSSTKRDVDGTIMETTQHKDAPLQIILYFHDHEQLQRILSDAGDNTQGR